MIDFIAQMLPCLLTLLGGLLIGWGLRGRAADRYIEDRAQVWQSERDGQLRLVRDRDAALAERASDIERMRVRLGDFEAQMRQLESRNNELAGNLAERDERLRGLQQRLIDFDSMTARLRDGESEVTRLRSQVLELEARPPKVVEKVVDRPIEKVVEKIVDRPVEKIVEKIVDRPVEKIVEKFVDRPVEKIVEKVVEKFVDRPVEKIVEKVVTKFVDRPVEKIVEKIVEKPVEVIVEKIVEVAVGAPPRAPRKVRIAKPRVKRARRRVRDNLELIHGVGPKLARFLHRKGVHLFRDVARWTQKDIDQFETMLPEFKGRIRREGWVKSARQEHIKKYGREP